MRTHALSTAVCALLLLLVPSLPGCAGGPMPDAEATAALPPSDFTLAFTVLARTPRRNVTTLPIGARPARFVMEADWVLRAYTGPAVTNDTFPRETRQLTAADVRALWSDLVAAGLLDPTHPGLTGRAPTPAQIDQADPAWAITYTADGARRLFVLEGDARTPATPLLQRLADLAWIPR